MKIIKTVLLGVAVGLLPACVTNGWNAINQYDEFTDTKICRVERGTQAGRDFARGFTGIYFSQHFYAENHNGEVRAGVRTEPPLPIGGDVQIKVGNKLYTLTSADAPIDIAPTIPMDTSAAENAMGKEYAATLQNMSKDIQKLSSPYRAYTGNKAKALLRNIANAQGEVKFRVVGINAAASATGSFTVNEEFTTALQACGINL